MANTIHLIGNLGRDVEQRFTQSGKAVSSFSIAVTDKYQGEESTSWFNCVAWNKTAEICAEYLSKGSQVYVSGPMKNKKWEDKDGNQRDGWEVTVMEMKMLGSGQGKKDDQGQRQGQNNNQQSQNRNTQNRNDYNQGPPDDDDSDIPF